MTESEWYAKYICEESDDCELIRKYVITGIGKPNMEGGKCKGYCKNENDDEPLEACKCCKICSLYGIE